MELVDYDPFGVNTIYQKPQGDVYTGKYFYTGQEWDTWTRLYYYGARYYFNEIGKFYSVDPAGFWPEYQQRILGNPQGWNSYAYVMNNPMKYVDPSGEVVHLFTPDTYWDLLNLGWDFLRGLKNCVEIATSGGIYVYGYLKDEEAIMAISLEDIGGDLEDLEEVREDFIFDSIALAIPVLPAGGTKIVRMGVKVDEVGKITSHVRNLDISQKAIKTLEEIKGFTKHGLNKIINEGMKYEHINDALVNTIKITERIDELGRTSFRYIGEKAVVIVNEAKEIIGGWLKHNP